MGRFEEVGPSKPVTESIRVDKVSPRAHLLHNVRATIVIILAIAIMGMLTSYEASGQCPMCKMSAESNLKNGGSAGKGLNAGILYMLALPYTLIGTIGYIWWRNRRKEEDEVEVLP